MSATTPIIAIVHFSASGTTARLAQAVAEGVIAGCVPEQIAIAASDLVEGRYNREDVFERLLECAAIVFGSPTYMGGPAAQFKAFADASSPSWEDNAWSGKLAAGFTCGSSPNGDQGQTIGYFATLAAQHGMIWCGLDRSANGLTPPIDRLGCRMGATAHVVDGRVDDGDLATAKYLGHRISQMVLRLNANGR